MPNPLPQPAVIEAVARALAADDSDKLARLWDEADSTAAEGMRENYREKAYAAISAFLAAARESEPCTCGALDRIERTVEA